MEEVLGEDSLLSRTDQWTTKSNMIVVPADETTPWATSGGIQAYWTSENDQKTQSKVALKELLQGVLDPETHLVPAIAGKMETQAFDVLFITGVGAVFPYIRSHNVLNNLQSTAKEQPTVMFFPGTYTQSLESGASLDLFGRLHDDKYYRAFNIYSIGI